MVEIERLAFLNDGFSDVAFGIERNCEEGLRERGEELGREMIGGGRFVVACLDGEGKEGKGGEEEEGGKKGEVVGWAKWRFVEDGEWSGDEGEKEEGKEEGMRDDQGSLLGGGVNKKFCEDVFIWADRVMESVCVGEGYVKLHDMIVSPQYQRKGIGNLLLEEGLKVVDEKSLQCVLGASKEGVGLYRKWGFREVEVKTVVLSEYVDGEGMVDDVHYVMWRSGKRS